MRKREMNALPVDVHALHRETRDVVNWDVVQLRMLAPILVQDQEQLLRSTKGEYGEEDSATTLHDVLDQC